ncbi:hypothetical protein [Alkaliphilus sp. B6464]|uniref:hypothetical protein n=1 Tax=Alkaliphilus sp. B6464 TaxID=2731219 RepID=UPI001BA830BA|nr:hypothetical protein [Alkaliphilus sp. B6464]QUH21754.1 hypothetical protein HYG84_17615 [Alkaliphilus sp. B6464]
MNTDKTLNNKFIENNDNPIWYYKELKSVDVDYVISYLLKETFVVDINGSKHEITFGKNRKGEIGQYIRSDNLRNSELCSFEVIEKGFREGKWFVVTDADTSDEFRVNYDKRKVEYEKDLTKEMYKSILKNAIDHAKDLSEEQRNKYMQELEDSSYEELENLINVLMESVKN